MKVKSMANCDLLVFFLLVFASSYYLCEEDHGHGNDDMPLIAITVLIKNNQQSLPYFLTCLEQLNYPKDHLNIWLLHDHNYDDSDKILDLWALKYKHLYNSFNLISLSENPFSGDVIPIYDTQQRRIKLKERALNWARKSGADFAFMLEPDVFLAEPATLRELVGRSYRIAAPMLLSDTFYSNFWLDDYKEEDPSSYKEWTESYIKLVKRDSQYRGCHNVATAHSTLLISLKHENSELLTFDPRKISNYSGPADDVQAFSASVKTIGWNFRLCNDMLYGFITTPTNDETSPETALEVMTNMKVEAIGREVPLPLDPDLARFIEYPKKTRLGCSKIYMINLNRRPERKNFMMMSFKELGIDVTRYNGVDGQNLSRDNIQSIGLRFMPYYEDPYHKRPMKAGEVGCFLSHYNLWRKIVRKNYRLTLILEDDVHFTANFREKFLEVLEETRHLDYDLLYLGRKILMERSESQITPHTTRPLYSYWTLGYLLTARGAEKLLAAAPLQNLLPVDEFLPIMFNQHPNSTWKSFFPLRNLNALSASPLLINPTHYTGMPGYISDTEDSYLVDVD